MRTGIVSHIYRVVLPGFVSTGSAFASILMADGRRAESKLMSGMSDSEYDTLRFTWEGVEVYQTPEGKWLRGQGYIAKYNALPPAKPEMKAGIVSKLRWVVPYTSVLFGKLYAVVKATNGKQFEFELFEGLIAEQYQIFQSLWVGKSVYQKPDGSWVRGHHPDDTGRKFKTVSYDAPSSPDSCIFCFRHKDSVPELCFYGMRHEFPEPAVKPVEKPVKIDLQVCIACRVHMKNPNSKTNGCEHIYPENKAQ